MKNGLCGIHPSKPGMLSAAFMQLSDLLYLDPWHLLSHAIFISQSYALRHREKSVANVPTTCKKNDFWSHLTNRESTKKGETFLVQMLSKNHHCKMQSKLHWMSDKGEYIHITLPLINKNMHLFPLEHTHSYQLVQGKAWVGVCVPLDLVDVLWQPYKICRFQTW